MISDTFDTYSAMRGKRSCPWCLKSKEPTWLENASERWMEYLEGRLSPKAFTWYQSHLWDVTYSLRIWRLGERWHYRYHLTAEERARLDDCPCWDHCEDPECTHMHMWGKGPKLLSQPPIDTNDGLEWQGHEPHEH